MGFYHPQCPPVRPHGMRPSCPGPCAPLGVPQRASPTEDVERRHAQAAGKRRRLPKDASTTKQSCGGRLAYQIWSFPGTKDTRCIPNTTTPYDIPRTRRQLAARQLRILICTCCRFFFQRGGVWGHVPTFLLTRNYRFARHAPKLNLLYSTHWLHIDVNP